jgi:hypothetical protein
MLGNSIALGEAEMGSKLLKASVIVLAAAMTGATGGLTGGAALGGIVGFIIAAAMGPGSIVFLTFIYTIIGGTIGAVTGLVIGTGTGVMGYKTDTGFDWAIITGIGTGLGAGIVDSNWLGIALLAGIGVTVGWLVACLIRRVFGGRIHRASMEIKVLIGYFTGLALITVTTSKILESIVSSVD